VSGPMLDRLDLQVEVPQIDFTALTDDRDGEPSATVRERVVAARAIQRRRFAGTGIFANAQMGPRQIARWCQLGRESMAHLGRVVTKRGISARGVHRILRVARTIADLNKHEDIEKTDLLCAIDFRALDQELR
jgi:magnesium chelatase family protein